MPKLTVTRRIATVVQTKAGTYVGTYTNDLAKPKAPWRTWNAPTGRFSNHPTESAALAFLRNAAKKYNLI
jgi:hypothetical protein